MSAAVKPALPSTQCYQRRRPEHTLWYRTVQTHFATWLALAAGPDDAAPPYFLHDDAAVQRVVLRSLCRQCGISYSIAPDQAVGLVDRSGEWTDRGAHARVPRSRR